MKVRKLLLFSLTLLLTLPAAPQQARSSAAASASTAVPPLIPYSGVVSAVSGAQTAASASITFLIYKDEQGGEPLFAETQAVAVDATGHYKAQLGATLTDGIPMDLFATGEARWLEVQVAGEAPQPRVLLVSVPYALKAADAATLGGLPPSAFALARPASEAASAVSPAITPNVTSNVTTTGGIAGYMPEFSGTSSVVDSPIFVNTDGEVGIGTATPTATLDVNGSTTLNGQLLLPATGTATATKGFNSQLFKVYTSALDSSSHTVVDPRFELEAEVTGNDTSAPGATLNLLSSTTASAAAETGFFFNSNGTIHFAPGQTFPGADITGTINASSYELGGALFATGSIGNSNVYLGFSGNTSSLNTSGGNSALGARALQSNTTGGFNTASGEDSLLSNTTGTLNTADGASALEFNTTGIDNTGSGAGALEFNTTGYDNTAGGFSALNTNTTGHENTASGFEALFSNTTGYWNTAVGAYALGSNTTGVYSTATGFNALGSNTSGIDNTASGFWALTSNGTGEDNTANGAGALLNNTVGSENTASGENALADNTTGNGNTAIGDSAGTMSDDSDGTGSSNTAVGSNSGFGTGSISNATAIGAFAEADQNNTLVLGCITGKNSCPSQVSVGIGTSSPDNLLTVNGTADKPGGGSWGTYSDGRLKTVNGSFGSGLGQVMQLRPIRYRYKPDNALGIRDADEHIGVVAQEVQRVIPEAVTENGKGYLLVNNDPIIWSMVNAIKEQQREIEEQRKMLRAQSAAMQSLAAEVRETRKTLRQVKAQAANGQLTMVASK